MDSTVPTAADAPSSQRRSLGNLGRVGLVVVALFALVVAGRHLGGYIPQFAAWVDGLGLWGPAVFVAGYAVATVAFIPGSLLTLAAGAIFGLAEGVLYVFLGAALGSASAFLLARYSLRGRVERWIAGSPRFQAVDRAIGREGWKIVVLLRLSPIFPYNLLNYALGLTKVRFVHYIVAAFGMLPGTLLYVYYGRVLGDVAALAGGVELERGPGDWALLILGLIATVAVTTLVTQRARRALKETVDE